jgi:UDPglucose--hexose-1-phosphate uridylyltransferase
VVAESPPLLHIEGDLVKQAAGICDRMEAIGAHEVVVENPSHETELEDLDEAQIFTVLDVLRKRAADLAQDPRLKQVFLFKISTCGIPAGSYHPRWHIVSTPFVPEVIKAELKGSARYFAVKERCVLCDYIAQERQQKSRIVCEDTDAVAVSPYAARFPFEVWVLPLKHSPDFQTMSPAQIRCVARILKRLARGLKRLARSEGYVMTIHTAPFRQPGAGSFKTLDLDYHWHMQVRPRLNSLNGLKESGGFQLNPISPEEAAQTLSTLC